MEQIGEPVMGRRIVKPEKHRNMQTKPTSRLFLTDSTIIYLIANRKNVFVGQKNVAGNWMHQHQNHSFVAARAERER